jgi:ribosome-binding factor A
MSHRVEQVQSLLKRAVSQVLSRRELSDPRIVGLISVTEVKVSPDMHDAYVYVSVLPAKDEVKVVAALKAATRVIQQQVKKAVALGMVPHLEFRLDESLKRQAQIDAAIARGRPEGTDQSQPGTSTDDGHIDAETDADADAQTHASPAVDGPSSSSSSVSSPSSSPTPEG